MNFNRRIQLRVSLEFPIKINIFSYIPAKEQVCLLEDPRDQFQISLIVVSRTSLCRRASCTEKKMEERGENETIDIA